MTPQDKSPKETSSKTEILLEKLLILELLNSGVKRDDICKILSIGSPKVSAIQKYLNKGDK